MLLKFQDNLAISDEIPSLTTAWTYTCNILLPPTEIFPGIGFSPSWISLIKYIQTKFEQIERIPLLRKEVYYGTFK
jgi:hypothetical protein